jgi:PAS domain S-box-containing protein
MDNSYNKSFDPNLMSLLEDAIDFAVYQIEVDPDDFYGGRIVMVSPSLKDIAGIEDPFQFESWFENVHPDDLPRVMEANRKSWQEAVRYDETVRQYNKSKNKWAWVRTISTPVFDSNNKLHHFTGFVIDITDQKNAEIELKFRMELENLILSLSTNFINLMPHEIDAEIIKTLDKIGEFTQVDRCYLFLFDKEQKTMSCTHEWCGPGISQEINNLQCIPIDELKWSNDKLLKGEILHIPSVEDLPPEAISEKEEFQKQAIQSLLAVPMVYQGQVNGLLGFDAVHNKKTWADESTALLQVVATIIVNALENKKVHEQLQAANQELEKRVLERTQELEQINADLQAEIEQRKNTETALNISRAFHTEVFEHSPLQIFIIEVLPNNKFRILRTNPAHQNSSGLTPEIIWGKTVDEVVIPEVAESINQHYAECVKTGKQIEYEERGPSPYWDVERMRDFRTKIAPIFDDAGNVVRLIGVSEDVTDLKAAEKILMEHAREEAVSTERSRLARELHDAVTQTLFSTTLTAEVLPRIFEKNPDAGYKKLDELRELTRGALAEMRTLLMELRPEALADAELNDLLQHLTNAFIARARIPIELKIIGNIDLPIDVKIGFYRIAQESLNNISKHADPEKVIITLDDHKEAVELIVEDDGVGFDAQQDAGTDHYGLRIMKERAAEIGAQLSISSQTNQGTKIHLLWKKTVQEEMKAEG